MKLTAERPFANPEAAVRKLVGLAARIEAVQEGLVHIENINAPFLCIRKASGPEFGAGIKHAVEHGWLELHESGTNVRLIDVGAKTAPAPKCRGRWRFAWR